MLVTMLLSHVFCTSDNVQCADIKPLENGKGNLFPADTEESGNGGGR